MGNNKLFIILSALVFILVLSTALVCGQCGEQISDEDKIDVDRDVAPVAPDSETIVQQPEEDGQENQQRAPTIYLEIIMGPTYAAANDVCFYRVRASVSGDPEPTIEWSKDDSHGAWGKDIAQVNLARQQTYTLTARAINSVGTAQDSITITWECEE